MGVTAMTDQRTEIPEIELRIAEIIIDELKIEDVTAQTFDVNLDLVDELGICYNATLSSAICGGIYYGGSIYMVLVYRMIWIRRRFYEVSLL